MGNVLRIGIIGAGTISAYHMNGYKALPNTKLCAICDLNAEAAKARAEEFGVEKVFTDYHDILNDPDIDAVSIVTPTFTHRQIVLDAIAAGKHALCEKPPFLTVAEAEECVRAAEGSDKLLMFGFVSRHFGHMKFLRRLVDEGKMGEIYYADLNRTKRCIQRRGWFNKKELAGGGELFDGAIHEIDSALYLMGYPKLKSVKGYTTDIHNALPYLVKGETPVERTTESAACAMITFENGACMRVQSGTAFLTAEEKCSIERCGTRAGAVAQVFKQDLKLVALDENDQLSESTPELDNSDTPHNRQIAHFVDCCLNGTECIVKPWQAIEVLKLICAVYESAETGREILF